jgi:hypothetical protein
MPTLPCQIFVVMWFVETLSWVVVVSDKKGYVSGRRWM